MTRREEGSWVQRFTRGRAGRSLGLVACPQVAKLILVGLVFFMGCGPIGPIPGGALSGELETGRVVDWSFASSIDQAQIETRPEAPHSVNTWFVAIGDRLYVPTSMILGPKNPGERAWVAHVAADDRVRIRLGRRIFERRAVRVADGSSEFEEARQALESRYALDQADRDPERKVWIFRLDSR
jgi:hypothetical protein